MKLDLKEWISKVTAVVSAVTTAYVVEQGTDANGWTYRKWSDGTLDAERARDIGQYTINTVEGSPIRVGSAVTSTLPSMAISGDLDVYLMGNSVNSPCWIEKYGSNQWRIAKVTTSNVTLQNLTVCERTVGARWK